MAHGPGHAAAAGDRGAPRARRPARSASCAAAALPVLLWRDVVGAIASEFHLELRYLVTGWAPWTLMALGLVCLLIAGVIDWRNRDRRFYGRDRRAPGPAGACRCTCSASRWRRRSRRSPTSAVSRLV